MRELAGLLDLVWCRRLAVAEGDPRIPPCCQGGQFGGTEGGGSRSATGRHLDPTHIVEGHALPFVERPARSKEKDAQVVEFDSQR